jgi:DNA-binding transcriptional regulator LsrR (DeoR family)
MQYRGRVKGKGANGAYVVAHPYYEQKLIQKEIAHRLEISRPTVARLSARVHRDGIVTVGGYPDRARGYVQSLARSYAD